MCVGGGNVGLAVVLFYDVERLLWNLKHTALRVGCTTLAVTEERNQR